MPEWSGARLQNGIRRFESGFGLQPVIRCGAHRAAGERWLLRALQNLTQSQIAGQLGISQARYSQLETVRDASTPNAATRSRRC